MSWSEKRPQAIGGLIRTGLLIAASMLLFECYVHAAPRIALLSLGQTETGRLAADKLAEHLTQIKSVSLIDRDRAAAAGKGVGYDGSLNLTLEDARNLGSAIDCDFYIIGDAQTLRRSGTDRLSYYEAYASLFIVDAKTGMLAKWYRPRIIKDIYADAQNALLLELNLSAQDCVGVINRMYSDAHAPRIAEKSDSVIFEEAPDDEKAAADRDIRLPQPYRRLRPEYPHSAAEADAEAIVDLKVDIDVKGEVADIEVVRWAGFGLDDAAINTVRQLHFRPAMRKGIPFPIRVLLRYNFRKPPR